MPCCCLRRLRCRFLPRLRRGAGLRHREAATGEATPDMATISLGVTTEGQTAAEDGRNSKACKRWLTG